MTDLVKKDPAGVVDNFAGWDDGVEGDDRPENAGTIQGTLVKFSAEGQWVDREGNEISGELELVAADVIRLVQKWQDQKPVETIIMQPHQKFPDVEAMNEAAPREEWEEGPAGLHGPWQAQHLLYLVNLETMDKYSFPSSTIGGRVAIRDLRDRIMWMRRLKGSNVYPVVALGRSWMNTKYGGRWRPTFIIKRWVRLFIMRVVEPLHPHDRSAFLQTLAHRLRHERELGDGTVYRVARETLRSFFKAPKVDPEPMSPTRLRRQREATAILED